MIQLKLSILNLLPDFHEKKIKNFSGNLIGRGSTNVKYAQLDDFIKEVENFSRDLISGDSIEVEYTRLVTWFN